jgi:hypothetical protein
MPRGRVFNPSQYYGQKYGRVTVKEFLEFRQSGKFRHAMFSCDCDCGVEYVASIYSLRSGNTSSCGCLRREMMTTHGKSRTIEYQIWEGVVRRGSGKEAREAYYERGIRICDEWMGDAGFANFLEHIGPRPSPQHSVDRIDNNRGYEPGNVRWATPREQSRNTRRNRWVTVDGERMCLRDACDRVGLKYHTVLYRLKRGWDEDRALRPLEEAA